MTMGGLLPVFCMYLAAAKRQADLGKLNGTLDRHLQGVHRAEGGLFRRSLI
jgi:hypothetical protein